MKPNATAPINSAPLVYHPRPKKAKVPAATPASLGLVASATSQPRYQALPASAPPLHDPTPPTPGAIYCPYQLPDQFPFLRTAAAKR